MKLAQVAWRDWKKGRLKQEKCGIFLRQADVFDWLESPALAIKKQFVLYVTSVPTVLLVQ